MPEIYRVDIELVKEIKWEGDGRAYDLELFNLCDESEFIVINPWFEDQSLAHYIHDIPTTDKCIVWNKNGNWIAKHFKRTWTPADSYHTIEFDRPNYVWRKNPDLDRTMTFEDDPYAVYIPDPWECRRELVWYIDDRFNPLDDRVWAIKCVPSGSEVLGTKDMPDLIPKVNIEYNKALPDFDLDIDALCPAYYDLAHECVYQLDNAYTPGEFIWVLKFTPAYRKPFPTRVIGTINPEIIVTYNPLLPEMEYNISDYQFTWDHFHYEYVWMLDNRHRADLEKEIWAFNIKFTKKPKKKLIVDYISPSARLTTNDDLIDIDYSALNSYDVPYYDFKYDHVWKLDPIITDTKAEIIAARLSFTDNPEGDKYAGIISPMLELLDVVFISNGELNAEDNWQRLLEFAPYAHRVDGVKGIFQAHKAAAKLSTTDMFFVVDADTYIEDGGIFKQQPNIFDRDCTYIWFSRNPVNNLVYGNGGVKLFPRKLIAQKRSWKELDFSISSSPKLKVIEEAVSSHNFNVDEFTTWRSAFRECVKLYTVNQMSKLTAWQNSDIDKPFGKYAVDGAHAGYEYAKLNQDNKAALMNINDYKWLKEQYERRTIS